MIAGCAAIVLRVVRRTFSSATRSELCFAPYVAWKRAQGPAGFDPPVSSQTCGDGEVSAPGKPSA
jgi:hypothetical protein